MVAPTDVNALIGGLLRDLAFAQPSEGQMLGYKRAANVVLGLERPVTALLESDGRVGKLPGIGPGSARVIHEVLDTGASDAVERAVDASGRRQDIERRRALRRHVLSRAEVLRVLADPTLAGPGRQDYRGDFQMHSCWSDGTASVAELASACVARGYRYAAITDHSHGLKIAGGMSMAEALEQRHAIADVNQSAPDGFRLIQGVEANIGTDGQLDLSDDEAASFEMVLAAPHSRLRKDDDQTERMVAAVEHPQVRILAHPRGRMAGSRAGVAADWDTVFAAAAAGAVAVEIDGDPARQDLDFVLAHRALRAGCLFALDSDAHTPGQLVYAETALAHARLAGIPSERVINCWPLDRLLSWLAEPRRERLAAASSVESSG